MTEVLQNEPKTKNNELRNILLTNAATPLFIFLAHQLAESTGNGLISTATYLASGTVILGLVTKDLALFDNFLKNLSSKN